MVPSGYFQVVHWDPPCSGRKAFSPSTLKPAMLLMGDRTGGAGAGHTSSREADVLRALLLGLLLGGCHWRSSFLPTPLRLYIGYILTGTVDEHWGPCNQADISKWVYKWVMFLLTDCCSFTGTNPTSTPLSTSLTRCQRSKDVSCSSVVKESRQELYGKLVDASQLSRLLYNILIVNNKNQDLNYQDSRLLIHMYIYIHIHINILYCKYL